ncbi:hypothetical protein BS50DRAFT_132381 [Corynespora cassiicola Philippines]|uniref:Uncharacterized protein n=1 Tax=Corynespora cassiicola Philippines TaxID=1448308 RepID=A0A2T2NC09_CORCC|nr:hypothetical protein BS50DRAFT_132381 [Corynespora cassiicola Philippines]
MVFSMHVSAWAAGGRDEMTRRRHPGAHPADTEEGVVEAKRHGGTATRRHDACRAPEASACKSMGGIEMAQGGGKKARTAAGEIWHGQAWPAGGQQAMEPKRVAGGCCIREVITSLGGMLEAKATVALAVSAKGPCTCEPSLAHSRRRAVRVCESAKQHAGELASMIGRRATLASRRVLHSALCGRPGRHRRY